MACTELMFSLRKGRRAEQLKWDSMRKRTTAWADLYGEGSLGMRDTIYYIYGRVLTATAYPTRGPWFR